MSRKIRFTFHVGLRAVGSKTRLELVMASNSMSFHGASTYLSRMILPQLGQRSHPAHQAGVEKKEGPPVSGPSQGGKS
jgi:hypothetical protein